MVKKVSSAVLALVFCLGLLAGCTAGSSEEAITDGITKDETDSVPESMRTLVDSLNTSCKENDIPLSIGIPEKTQNAVGEGYEIPIRSTETSGSECELSFLDSEDLSPDMSFSLPDDSSLVRNFITALIVAFNEKDMKTAQAQTQELVNTVKVGEYSEIIECGNYLVFIEYPDNSHSPRLFMQDRNSIWEDIDKSQYQPVSYSAYQSPAMNTGTKVALFGKILSFEREAPGVASFANIGLMGEDGNQYKLVYSFTYSPIMFNPGENITVYGSLSELEGNPCIRVDRIETN